MDGNGRWAIKKKLKRIDGHKAGVRTVKKITKHCTKLGVKNLTLYTFSNENWLRPIKEVKLLMNLFVSTLNKEIELLIDNNIKFRVIGDKNKLDFITKKNIEHVEKLTKCNTGMGMNLAMSYGGRQEILQAINKIIDTSEKNINEKIFEKYLYTNQIGDPDLLIRPGKEKRISNFFLWQLAYSEIYFSDVLWPDFNEKELDKILIDYNKRERRYGKISGQIKK
tara:strand:+ start:164 stop:832 length:669 start_codon:yes stop_codon:yes gene_type:complete